MIMFLSVSLFNNAVRESEVEAFLSPHNFADRTLLTEFHSTAIPRKGNNRINRQSLSSSKDIGLVNFWANQIQNHQDEDVQEVHDLPADRNLDRRDGELPPGSYLTHGNPEYDVKKSCRVILALDWKQKNAKFKSRPLDSGQVIKKIHECIAAGFQTFQLMADCNEVEMIGRVLRETPTFVEMHWIVNLELPRQISTSTVRATVFDLLSRMQSNSLDTLLVPYRSDLQSQYLFEVLDVLQDMQRDGYIRSIGVEDWPFELIEEAKSYGLSIDICQRSGNLLLPSPQDGLQRFNITEWWTNPLAGNFLSDTFVDRSQAPWRASGWKEIQRWFDIKKKPKKSVSDTELWRVFQNEVYRTLQQLSWKYEMTIATIILRWSLQEKIKSNRNVSPSSVVYPIFFMEEPEDLLAKQLRDLRDVVRFQLNDEDLEALNAIAARPKPKATSLRIDEVDVRVSDIPLEFLKEFEAMNAGRRYYDASKENVAEGDEGVHTNFDHQTLWL
jgi:aryl-alcohol dehydrogenase-like predicted oxidoreductase